MTTFNPDDTQPGDQSAHVPHDDDLEQVSTPAGVTEELEEMAEETGASVPEDADS